jgi:hypothetical protein
MFEHFNNILNNKFFANILPINLKVILNHPIYQEDLAVGLFNLHKQLLHFWIFYGDGFLGFGLLMRGNLE